MFPAASGALRERLGSDGYASPAEAIAGYEDAVGGGGHEKQRPPLTHRAQFRMHRKHVDVQNLSHGVPLLNRFLSFCYSISWPVLLSVMVASFALLALPEAALVTASGCTERGFVETWILSLAHLVSFEENPCESESPGCVLLTAGFSLLALAMQAAIFALCVTRFLNPNIELVMPTRLCVVRRDGRPHLSLRLIHPQGHLVSNVSVHAVWLRPRETSEGESFVAMDALPFNDHVHRHVWMPATYLHALDSTASPLGRHCADVRAAPGWLV